MQTVSKRIGDFEYEITKPLTEQGLEFSLAVAKYAVPFLVQLDSAIASKDIAQIMAAATQVIISLKPEDLKYINKVLGELTQVHHLDGSERVQILRHDVLQQHFCDQYDAWITWVVFGIQTVCGSFFSGALGLGALLKKKSQSAAQGRSAAEAKAGTDTASQSPSPVERTG